MKHHMIECESTLPDDISRNREFGSNVDQPYGFHNLIFDNS